MYGFRSVQHITHILLPIPDAFFEVTYLKRFKNGNEYMLILKKAS